MLEVYVNNEGAITRPNKHNFCTYAFSYSKIIWNISGMSVEHDTYSDFPLTRENTFIIYSIDYFIYSSLFIYWIIIHLLRNIRNRLAFSCILSLKIIVISEAPLTNLEEERENLLELKLI